MLQTILKNNTARQILGACGGMALAAMVYVGIESVSMQNIKGILVSPNQNISEKTHQVRVNDKNIDDDSLRRIESRAKTVTDLMAKADEPGTPQTRINQNVETRLAARQGAYARTKQNANPQEYAATRTFVSEYDRLKLRAARIADRNVHAAASTATPLKEMEMPSSDVASESSESQAVMQPAPLTTSEIIATAAQHHGKSLPNSGPLLNVLILTSALLAGVALRRRIVTA